MPHTPGPWVFSSNDGDSHIKSPDGKLSMCDTSYYPWIDATKADWTLIAAAPDLLEEAKSTDQGYSWFIEQLQTFMQDSASWSPWAYNLLVHLQSRQIGIRAVIAKAEGTDGLS